MVDNALNQFALIRGVALTQAFFDEAVDVCGTLTAGRPLSLAVLSDIKHLTSNPCR